MRPVLINGLGCFEGGARVVLEELARAYPRAGPPALLIAPSTFRVGTVGSSWPVRVITLNHRVFGRHLRPLVELLIWSLTRLGRFSHVVNLSHYGWCGGRSYVLYFHNEMLLNALDQGSLATRLGNSLKRWWFQTCLERADRIVVQSERVATSVRAYASARGVAPPEIVAVIPRVVAPRGVAPSARAFDVQFFYPSSGFDHKRSRLAILGCIEANRRDHRIGLVLTEVDSAASSSCIRHVGTLTPDAVAATYMASDALLFTSSHESLGLPLLEALAHGLPAVLPAIEYAREIYGDAAVYFEGNDPRAVAGAVMECVANRDELRANAARRWDAIEAASKTWDEHWEILGVTAQQQGS